MRLKPYSSVFHSVLVHKNNNIPIQLADRFINPVIAPDYLKQDFQVINPADYLLKVAPEYRAEHIVEALLPEAWIRQLLEINDAEPCLALRRITWVAGCVATMSYFYYPGLVTVWVGDFLQAAMAVKVMMIRRNSSAWL